MALPRFVLPLCALLVMMHVARAADAPPRPQFPLGPELQKIPLEDIEKAYAGQTPPEAIRMYLTIVKGGRMTAGDGWFGPAQTRFTPAWLQARLGLGAEPRASLAREKFPGPAAWFERLDRNRDGRVTLDDLDWSERNPWVQNAYLTNRLFRQIDPSGDGRLTRSEWLAFFDAVAQGKDSITFSQLREPWLSGMTSNFKPGDAPTKEVLLRGLFAGEVGSMQEGPQVDAPAPDFALRTHDGQRTIRLSEVIGPKPVVLVFGNYTCGPFRSMYPEVDEIARRFRDEAVFLGVYVREAHPTDGWHMRSNDSVGVKVAQPKTLAERTAVAQQCCQLLAPSIPVVVDDVDDATGHAYSGMPARLYVIDRAGKVAFKGGRGPFGFKAGEREQALVLTLIDQAPAAAPSN